MSKVVACHCNRLDVLEMQLTSLERMCLDLDEIIVVNDGLSPKLRVQIRELCSKHKIATCWDFPIDIDHSSPSFAVGALQQWAYDRLTDVKAPQSGKVAFFDGDLFPLKPFRVSDYLQTNTLAGLPQDRAHVRYLWAGFVFIDLDRLIRPWTVNWNCGIAECQNVDTLGMLHHHFRECGTEHVRFLSHTSHLSHDKISKLTCCPTEVKAAYDEEFKIEVMEDGFLHYGRCSNWSGDLEALLRRKDIYVESWLKSAGSIP